MNAVFELFKNKNYEKIIEVYYDNIDELETSAKQFSTKWLKEQKNKDIELLLDNSIDQTYHISEIKLVNIFLVLKYSLFNVFAKKKKLELLSQSEFAKSESDIKFNVIVGNEELTKKAFFTYVILYYVQSYVRMNIFSNDKTNNKSNIAIDFEFRRKEIALMQLNFENVIDSKNPSNAYIWLINPGKFTDRELSIFVNLIMTNSNIYKIFHGPDSLDIPYMYEHMFKKNKEIMRKFMSKLFDTRYFCEYFKLNKGLDRSCSYYVSLLHFNTIDRDKYDELEKNRELMGPVQDINWDIEKLSSFHLKYALYDVLFLSQHTRDLGYAVKEKDFENIYAYKYYNYFIRFIYMEQNKVTDIIPYCKTISDPINNYIVVRNGVNYTLIKLFTNIINNLVIKLGKEKIDYKFITHVRLISNNLNYLIKLVVYYLCYEMYEVFEKKNHKSKKKINISAFFELLKSYELHHISGFVIGVIESVKQLLKENSGLFK